jgi:predicted enzyme related to lactoylglutathione lyase
MSGKVRAGGLMALPDDDGSATPPHWIIYVGTSDVDATVEAAEKLGGKVLKPAADIPNVGRFAVLSDPQGAAFAVFTPSSTPDEGMSAGGGVGDFTWHELATTDLDAAFSFYSELFGWEKGPAHDMGEPGIYQIVKHGGQDVGGIWKARDNSTPPNWLSYVRVEDAAKAASAVKAAGGRVLNGPMEVPGGSWIVQLLDPQGGAFALVESAHAASGESADDEPAAPARKKATKKAAKKKAPAGKAPAKAAPAKAAPAKAVGKAAKKAAKKSAGKTAKKAAKKVAKKAAKKAVAKPAAKKVAKKVAKKAVKKAAPGKSKRGAPAKAKGKAARKK